MKILKRSGIVLLMAALLLPLAVSYAFANSGVIEEVGETMTGVYSVHGDSVLEVQSENLTFNIDNMPQTLEEGEKLKSTVTAEYVFYNPTAETVTTKMAFPIGEFPYYDVDVEVEEISSPITVNGQAIEYETRHTLGDYISFDIAAAKIADGYIQSDFYSLDLPVTEYTFSISTSENYIKVSADSAGDKSETRYVARSSWDDKFVQWGGDGYEFTIVVLGKDIDLSSLEWTAYRDGKWYESDYYVADNSIGSVNFVKKESYTFSDYVFEYYDESCGISEMDWYNGIVGEFDDDLFAAYTGANAYGKESFIAWYTYETTVEAYGTFTNTVTAEAYPTIRYNYVPRLSSYCYYLSPAQGWASFKDLTVEIKTDAYLYGSVYIDSLSYDWEEVFEETETGYKAYFESLPDGELEFYLSPSETVTYYSRYAASDSSGCGNAWIITFGVIVISAIVLPLLIAAFTLVTYFADKREAKKALAENAKKRESLKGSSDGADNADGAGKSGKPDDSDSSDNPPPDDNIFDI